MPDGNEEAMKHTWTIEPTDIKKVKAFLDHHQNNLFVRERIKWNLRDDKPPPGKADFWQQMVACLLTTQQCSAPTSAHHPVRSDNAVPAGLQDLSRTVQRREVRQAS